jgi:hypothetical protein
MRRRVLDFRHGDVCAVRTDVDPDRVGILGSSFSSGNVLWVGAVDRRVKVVLSQVPLVDAGRITIGC